MQRLSFKEKQVKASVSKESTLIQFVRLDCLHSETSKDNVHSTQVMPETLVKSSMHARVQYRNSLRKFFTIPSFYLKLKKLKQIGKLIEVEKYKPRAATEITELQRLHFATQGSFVLLKHLYFSARSLVNLHFLDFLPDIVLSYFNFYFINCLI